MAIRIRQVRSLRPLRALRQSLIPATARPGALASALAIAGLCGTAAAQQPAGNAAERTLDEVVVTASGVEQALKDAPATITVIGREELERQPTSNVVDVVRQLPGVNLIGGSPNETDISIRGLPGDYTLILVDGRRQNTRETMNRGTTGVQASFLPPLEAIERIEVVRGPMSSLYGSDAIGGVINIITRKVPKKLTGSVTVGGTIQQDSDYGNTGEGEFWLGAPVAGKVGLQVFGRMKNRGEDDIYYPRPVTSGANGLRERNLGVKLSIQPAANQDIDLVAGTETLRYTRTPGRSIAATAAATRTEHGRDYFGITHTGRWAFGNTTVSLNREIGEQQSWSTGVRSTVAPEVTNTVLDGLLTKPFERHLLRVGLQYRVADVEGLGRQDAVAGLPVNVDDVSLTAWALFAEDDFFVTDRFTLTAGARYDHDERYGGHWAPRLYGVYQLNPTLTLRGGLAGGFKAPTVRQSVAGYCMTTGGGTQAQGTLCGNPDLKPETSFTQEIGIAYAEGKVSASATLFNNRFRNKVASYDTGVPDPRTTGRSVYVYDNIARVNLRGLELAGSAPLGRTLSASGNYTYTQSKRKGGGEYAFNGSSLDGYPLEVAPEHALKARLDWQASAALSTFLRVNVLGKQTWAAFRNGAVGPRERPGATTIDLGGQYTINRHLAVKAALLNVTDKIVPIDDRSRNQGLNGNWMVDEGRRLWLGLTGTF